MNVVFVPVTLYSMVKGINDEFICWFYSWSNLSIIDESLFPNIFSLKLNLMDSSLMDKGNAHTKFELSIVLETT